MAVALFYNSADLAVLQPVVTTAANASSGADRTQLNRIATGIATWQTAPIAPAQYQQGDGDTRILVLGYTNATKAGILALWQRVIDTQPAVREMFRMFLKDMRSSSVDPWTG